MSLEDHTFFLNSSVATSHLLYVNSITCISFKKLPNFLTEKRSGNLPLLLICIEFLNQTAPSPMIGSCTPSHASSRYSNGNSTRFLTPNLTSKDLSAVSNSPGQIKKYHLAVSPYAISVVCVNICPSFSKQYGRSAYLSSATKYIICSKPALRITDFDRL